MIRKKYRPKTPKFRDRSRVMVMEGFHIGLDGIIIGTRHRAFRKEREYLVVRRGTFLPTVSDVIWFPESWLATQP